MVCLMAAVNVAATKTPVSTSIILSVLSGTAMLPVIVIASFVSFVLTSHVVMIGTQRERQADPATRPHFSLGLPNPAEKVFQQVTN